jgi:hypothetical protein
MKRVLCAAFGLLLAVPGHAQDKIEPNSTFFRVQDYFYPNQNGDYEYYQVSGYRQAPSPGVAPTIFLLPTIVVQQSDIKYFRPNGLPLDPSSGELPGLITIKPTYFAGMPGPAQMPAIAAALDDGVSTFRYLLPAQRNGNAPVMFAEAVAAPHIRAAIEEDYAAYQSAVDAQSQMAAKYSGYQKRSAPLTDVEVRLLVGGEIAASKSYTGSLVSMGQISLVAPTEFQANQIRSGNFELEVVSRFRDTKTGSISASFDARTAVNSFVEETQKALTKSKSSGFQVFGMGSRRSKISTSINSSMKANGTVEQMDRTQVVMYDASDAMIAEFESKFFPSLSRQEVIDNHISAAAEAQAAGNHELARLHADYADAIGKHNQMKEVDTVAAAAALSSGDYAGFLAHGVRSINGNDSKANSFRRLETRETVVTQATNWDQVRIVTVNREVSVPVMLEPSRNYVPRVGICGIRQDVDYGWVKMNVWGQPQMHPEKGVMVSCIEAASPAAMAGLLPGMTIRFIGDDRIRTVADMERALRSVEPGDTVNFYVVQSPGPSSPVSTDRLIRVTSKRGPAQ